ncbi:MAG: Fpg/Nei family DNA glycosylase, partial [Candidatus Eiseniibacteriota bacterium]
MPELPDIVVYCERLAARILDARLVRAVVVSPNLLRTAEPPLDAAHGRAVTQVRRVGKRIVVALEGDLCLVLHLMIAGRLRWRPAGTRVPGRIGLAGFEFSTGTLLLTEASTRQRASLHLVAGEAGVAALDPGGIEPLEATFEGFRAALQRGNHTLKRSLTDPATLSGIGNSYSDEILHRARLSPLTLTSRLSEEECRRLHAATRATLVEWTDRLRREVGDGFPEKVTAFRDGMAVHGRYRQPCPDCGAPVQRIVYAEHETNYCA